MNKLTTIIMTASIILMTASMAFAGGWSYGSASSYVNGQQVTNVQRWTQGTTTQIYSAPGVYTRGSVTITTDSNMNGSIVSSSSSGYVETHNTNCDIRKYFRNKFGR